MKSIEERLRELPEIAMESGLEADERLKRRILMAAEGKADRSRRMARRCLVPALCAAAVIIVLFALGPLTKAPEAPLITAQSAGDGRGASEAELTGDVRGGSVTITSGKVPGYQSIWAQGSGGNFPLVAVNGRYYRLLTSPSKISSSLLGSQIGTVQVKTDEPALCREDVFSNVVEEGQAVYALAGMDGAMAAATVDGSLRVFQRVAFSGSAVLGGESLRDTLKAAGVSSVELTDVGTVSGQDAEEMVERLVKGATYQNASCTETKTTLLIRLNNGLTLQMCVNGDLVSGCGTWSCPDFFEHFPAAGGGK